MSLVAKKLKTKVFFQGVCSSFKFERSIRRTESNYTDELIIIWLWLCHSTSIDDIVNMNHFCLIHLVAWSLVSSGNLSVLTGNGIAFSVF